MAGMPLRTNARYSWDDYRTWPDDQRWEIIGGGAFDMSPAPLLRHQIVTGRLFAAADAFLRGTKCRAFVSPVDVRLSAEDVVQPDIVVVCDPDQTQATHIEGPPTLVVEVTSPSSLRHDRVRKVALYAAFGVREYWIVTPHPSLIEVFVLKDDGGYRLHAGYEKHEVLRSPVFPDLTLRLADVFDFPLEPGEDAWTVKEGRPPYASKRRIPRGQRGASAT